MQDYYSADFQQSEIPESYVSILTNSGIQGLDNLSPKLAIPVDVGSRQVHINWNSAYETSSSQKRSGKVHLVFFQNHKTVGL